MTTDTPPPPASGGLRAWISRPPDWARRTARAITVLELVLAGIFLTTIFVLVLIQAAQRYLPIDGWSWTGELARFSLVWLTFTTAGVLVSRDGHISLEMLDGLRSEPLRRAIRVISCLIVAAVGVALVVEAWTLVDTQGILKSPAMRMPMSWFYGLTLIGFVSTIIRSLAAAVRYAVLGAPEPAHLEMLEGVG